MKKIIFFLLFASQLHAVERDSIVYKNQFTHYILASEDFDCDACGCSAAAEAWDFRLCSIAIS